MRGRGAEVPKAHFLCLFISGMLISTRKMLIASRNETAFRKKIIVTEKQWMTGF